MLVDLCRGMHWLRARKLTNEASALLRSCLPVGSGQVSGCTRQGGVGLGGWWPQAGADGVPISDASHGFALELTLVVVPCLSIKSADPTFWLIVSRDAWAVSVAFILLGPFLNDRSFPTSTNDVNIGHAQSCLMS